MEKIIVLLRGINVGGNRRVPMADLRAAVADAGVGDLQTYIQSGNLILTASSAVEAEALIEAIVAKRFGFEVEAIARTAARWAAYARHAPFPDADARGNLVHLGLSKSAPPPGIAAKLAERAVRGERILVIDDAIWIDFQEGVADTKLTPAFVDRVVGSTVTMRNWRTVRKLAEMSQITGG